MARQLVVCLDGTGNRFSHLPTNVIHILRSLSTDSSEVLPFYQAGVGTFGIKEALFEWQKLPSRIFGLAIGWGFSETVQCAYEFLAQNYRDGDEIFIFGFSRGAYSARALAALIHACGLVQPHQLNLFDYAWAMLIARVRTKGQPDKPDYSLQDRFKETFGRDVRIRFLGLFDTVKSVGWLTNPITVPYSTSNASVQTIRHAQSIDERRAFFRQNSWHEDPSIDVKQVWFAGAHSDVGGGYPIGETQLATVALCWMLGEAIHNGLNIDPKLFAQEIQPPNGDPPDMLARPHNSMNRWWKLAEWVPQYTWDDTRQKRRWFFGTMPPFRKPRPRNMLIKNGDQILYPKIHVSVEKRLLSNTGYAPPNLPDTYTVVHDLPDSPCH